MTRSGSAIGGSQTASSGALRRRVVAWDACIANVARIACNAGISRISRIADVAFVACIAFVAFASAPAAAQAVHAIQPSSGWAETLDRIVAEGYEHPAAALAKLRALANAPAVKASPAARAPRAASTPAGTTPVERHLLWLAIGGIEAQTGGAARAGAIADQLQAAAADDPTGRAGAASTLVRALVSENAGQLDVAAALAQSALPVFEVGCFGAEDTTGRACWYRTAWRALQIMERRAFDQGLAVTATAHAHRALALAEWAGDARRRALNLVALARYANGRGDTALAQRLVGEARQAIAALADPIAEARLKSAEAGLTHAQGDVPGALRGYDDALALAARADAPRLEAMLLTNLSDAYIHQHRPAEALRAAERALEVVRRYDDLRAERPLLNNIGIAKIHLGRIAEGKRDLAKLLQLREKDGETGRQATTLLEFGEALAAAGDARGALELFHRERAITTALMQANRTIALKEMQSRNDADAHQRDIELLARDNALKTEALASRSLQQRIGWLLATVMVLAFALVAILYGRVRQTHRRLEANHLQLQAQSERDPLTNLANRRHFQEVMTRLTRDAGFEGALLLIDIDHFKHVNDAHGHAAGDQVLIEVARRLNDAVRSDDLVVRWGGEEFLVLAPHAANEQAEQMAARVLRILGQTPIFIGGGGGENGPEVDGDAPTDASGAQPLRVTASIGYARFPLPPYGAEVPWEQAVELVDMALYTAKNQGRNRAVGIISTTAATADALHAAAADFERAWREGRVTLAHSPGPQPVGAAARVA